MAKLKTLKLRKYFFIGNDVSQRTKQLTEQLEEADENKTLEIETVIGQLEKAKIETIQSWLLRQLLHGKESRGRTKFLKLLDEKVTDMNIERRSISEDHCEKDKKGLLIYLDKNGKDTTEQKDGLNFKIVDKNVQLFNKEMRDYMEEDMVIDVTPANSETIYAVRDIILNTNENFSDTMAAVYDEWAGCFEEIK